ncbi:MAG: hypothetical protein QXD03_05170 [Candidatus Anstonellales archaeon]
MLNKHKLRRDIKDLLNSYSNNKDIRLLVKAMVLDGIYEFTGGRYNIPLGTKDLVISDITKAICNIYKSMSDSIGMNIKVIYNSLNEIDYLDADVKEDNGYISIKVYGGNDTEVYYSMKHPILIDELLDLGVIIINTFSKRFNGEDNYINVFIYTLKKYLLEEV